MKTLNLDLSLDSELEMANAIRKALAEFVEGTDSKIIVIQSLTINAATGGGATIVGPGADYHYDNSHHDAPL